MRTWGGNELVMDDSRNNKSVKLSSEGERYLELHDGDELVRVKSADSELLFNDAEKRAEINAGGNAIGIIYKDDEGNVSIKTVKDNTIEMNDPDDTITIQNAGEDGNKVVLNGDDKSITLDSMDNTMVVNGKDKRITLESEDNKVVVDGGDNSVTMDAKTNVIIKAGKDINLKSGGKLVIDAKGGIVNKSPTFNITKSGQSSSQSDSVKSEKKAKDVAVVTGVTGGRIENNEDTNDADDTAMSGPDEGLIEDTDTSQETEPMTEKTEFKIMETYWTYGENYTRLCDKEENGEDVSWQTKYYYDLNFHVVAEKGNDGKMMEITLKDDDNRKINLRKVVSGNSVVFDKVFVK
jgi:hypothetical protein